MLCPSEEGPRYQNAKGTRLASLVMFLDTLLFGCPVKMEERALSVVGKSQRGAFAHQVLCTDDTSIAYTLDVLRWQPLQRMRSKLKRPPTFLRFCTLWSENQNKSRRGRNAAKAYGPSP